MAQNDTIYGEKIMFKTHKLTEKGFEKMKEFKFTMGKAVETVLKKMPDSREKSIFKTKIEEGMFFGAKAIAEKPENHSEVINYLEQ